MQLLDGKKLSEELFTFDYVTELLLMDKYVLKKKFGIKYLGVFGSYVKDKQTKNSDLDILVDFYEDGYFWRIYSELEQHLEQLLNLKIDIVPKANLRNEVGKRIMNEVQRLM